MSNKKLGIPYMGSKRALAKDIVDYMIENNPDAKYYYDLFGGGGAISFELLQRNKVVHYNELNTGVVKLLEKIKAEGITPEFYNWVGKETFHKHKKDDTWYGGLLKTCWSFSNNQKDYLFGYHLTEKKRLLHEIIVNKCNVSRNKFKELTGLYIEDDYLIKENINDRRLGVMKLIKSVSDRFDVQQLQQLQQLNQLNQLERLQQLEQLQQLIISNKSYLDVEINTPIEETIIYLDPPYFKARGYQENVCHKELMEYIKQSPYKIYISSYEADLPEVWNKARRCPASSIIKGNKVTEKLFCNREGITKEDTIDNNNEEIETLLT
jgi:site-specific DNA-adenine methylase